MDIPKLSDSTLNTSSRPLLPTDLFRQLSQLGSIEARVASISRGQALLNSQLGQILSANTLDLKAGDLLKIRVGGNQLTPVLKVSKLPPQPVTLTTTQNLNLSRILSPVKPVTALIIGHQASNTLIQLGDQRIAIQMQPDLKSGQLISLEKAANGKSIEIRPVNNQQVLKSAISQLLPKQANLQPSTSLTQLARLIQGITLSINTAQMSPSTIKTGPSVNTEPQNINLFTRLEGLIGTLPALSKLDKTTIQQWVRYILADNHNRSERAQVTSNPYQLLQQLPKTEASMRQQLQQWSNPPPPGSQSQASQIDLKPLPDEMLQQISRDIIKLVEQSSSQLLLQQTNLRYQQELQQPIALNIAIPLTDQQKIQELRLKIRQRKCGAEMDKQSWDIQLDFEFGLLGLISTHLLLEDEKLSASFWSSKLETQEKIDSNLSDFKTQISRVGLKLGQFHSFLGNPPEINERDNLAMPETLLDIKV